MIDMDIFQKHGLNSISPSAFLLPGAYKQSCSEVNRNKRDSENWPRVEQIQRPNE